MDDTQKYFVTTIVGQPARLVMGQQLRFDADPGIAVPTQETKSKPIVVLAFRKMLSKYSGWRAKRVTRGFATSAEVGHPALALQPSQSKRQKQIIGVATGLTLAVALIVMGFQWADEYRESKGAAASAEAEVAVQTPAVAVAKPQASTIPLPIERSAGVASGADALTIINEPSPNLPPAESPLPPGFAGREGAPLGIKPTQTPPVQVVAAPVQKPVVVENSKVSTKEEKIERSVIVDASKQPERRTPEPIKPAPASDETTPTVRKFAQPVDVKPTQPIAATTGGTSPEGNQAAPKAPEKVTVVDIAPDGSYVLISNPTTRLPQKYLPGQKIFTGESIKSIDSKSGQLTLDSRTLTME